MYNLRLIKNGKYYTDYKVEKGDTLYKISKLFNVNPKLIAYINGMEMDDYLYEGDTIKVPNKGVEYYITKENDTLNSLEKVFNSDISKIIDQNKEIYLLPQQMIFKKE